MTGAAGGRRQWAWHVSALAYRWSYLRVTHYADEDLFRLLGDRVRGATVIDCGCGPGVLSQKLLHVGAGHVLAVDANRSMIRQARRRLAGHLRTGRATVAQAYVDSTFFAAGTTPVDLVIFKRSLYAPPGEAVATVRSAVGALAPGGGVIVVHPERSAWRYAFGVPPRWRRHTAFHLANRAVSVAAARLGVSGYRTHSVAGLLHLLSVAAPGARVEAGSTTQQAYHVAALWSSGQR